MPVGITEVKVSPKRFLAILSFSKVKFTVCPMARRTLGEVILGVSQNTSNTSKNNKLIRLSSTKDLTKIFEYIYGLDSIRNNLLYLEIELGYPT
ncbi:hypothetical protein M0802_009694 [Mischocyttarus mexicanus]|nr:hypothetical protein M0802_009694 [Mischocyttarus mexicanus]